MWEQNDSGPSLKFTQAPPWFPLDTCSWKGGNAPAELTATVRKFKTHGGFSENGPRRLTHLHPWSTGSGTV